MKIGWIGTGVMGNPMAGHLLAAGHELWVYSRTKEKAQNLLNAGAHWTVDVSSLASEVDVVCSMVSLPEDVREIYLGENGLLEHALTGSVLIDFTTSLPELAREIHEAAIDKGIRVLDAPVSGGDIGAQAGALSIMVGGDEVCFNKMEPLFQIFGKTVVYQGVAGSGQDCKAVNQIIAANTMLGICEGLVYARKAGLDPETVLESVGSGAATSWALVNLWPRMLSDDFSPGFFIEHFIKDMRIALAEAGSKGLTLPGTMLVYELYEKLSVLGHGRDGTQRLIKALEI